MPVKIDQKQLKYCIQDLLYKKHGIMWPSAKTELAKTLDIHIGTLERYMRIREDEDEKIPLEKLIIIQGFFKVKSTNDLLSGNIPVEQNNLKKSA